MKRIIKLFFINLGIFLTLLILLNLSAVIVFRTYRLLVSDDDHRSSLPNYTHLPWAVKHFEELSKIKAEYRSYTGWRRLPFKGETINIDENGIRFTREPETYSDTLPLVVFTGGSAMWGTGSDDMNTIPSIFTQISGGSYRSLNLAESGYNVFQEFLFLKLQMISGLKPDIIVSYSGANETDALSIQNRPLSHTREIQIARAVKGMDHDEVLSFKHFLITPLIEFVNKLRLKAGNRGEDKYDLSPSRIGIVAGAFLESWESMKDLAEQNGAVFIGVLQPTIYRGNPRTDHLGILENHEPAYDGLYNDILKKLNDAEHKELSQYVIDPSDLFDSKEYIYIDEVHVSPEGNKIISELILNNIKRLTEERMKR